VTLARSRATVLLAGLVVLAAVVLGLLVVGGPEAGRRDRRDAARLADIRQIADAIACHAAAKADPPAPSTIEQISPACLARGPQELVDPSTGAAFAIERPTPDLARVCADFEAPSRGERWPGWPPFDAATGCVSVSVAAPVE
jgi:hypothetical protein